MFPKTKNIEAAFQHIRFFTLAVIIGCLGMSSFIVWRCFRMAEKAQSSIYVLSGGKVLEAISGDRKDNIPVEARDHIRVFHQFFFTLSPDEKQIMTGITRSFYLADASVKRVYDNLKESGYYAGIVSGNINQEVSVDSIQVNTDTYPFYFRCFATQKIIRPTSLVIRDLLTEGWLRNTSRSDNNPHGFLIERWSVLENRDLKVEAR